MSSYGGGFGAKCLGSKRSEHSEAYPKAFKTVQKHCKNTALVYPPISVSVLYTHRSFSQRWAALFVHGVALPVMDLIMRNPKGAVLAACKGKVLDFGCGNFPYASYCGWAVP